MWRYEYAIHNMSSHRSGGSFEVAFADGAAISNTGFHDVPYHSGEPYDGTDWPAVVDNSGNTVRWETTEDFATNANANALRWGTLYNFWFESDTPPDSVDASIGLFRPGTPTSVSLRTIGPGDPDIFSDGFESGNVTFWTSATP